jgi:hypothetical protein
MAPTLTLQIQESGSSTAFVSQCAGSASSNLSSVGAAAPGGTATATTELQLDDDLGSADPVGTVDLGGATIYVNQPLQITHSVVINGGGGTIWFDQSNEYHSGGNTAVWPSADDGAIFVSDPTSSHITVTLEYFTIKFDSNTPIQWSDGSGGIWDPENNFNNLSYAVINTGGSNWNGNSTTLNLQSMSIYGPPAFESSAHYSSLKTEAGAQGELYVGEPDIDVVDTNGGPGGISDNGTISGSTFQGGTVELHGGPWTVTNNFIDGAVADTYSAGAFAVHQAHDLLLQGNQVTQLSTAGYLFRLLLIPISGFDDTVESNTFGGGNVGFLGQQVTYYPADNPPDFAAKSGFGPEIVLLENTPDVAFEGRPGAISPDGRELVLPNVRSVVGTYSNSAYPTGAALIVSILSGVNSGGSPNMSMAGEWFQVAQQISFSTSGSLELLMENPLPAMPVGGYYVVELTSGYVNNSILDNNINT